MCLSPVILRCLPRTIEINHYIEMRQRRGPPTPQSPEAPVWDPAPPAWARSSKPGPVEVAQATRACGLGHPVDRSIQRWPGPGEGRVVGLGHPWLDRATYWTGPLSALTRST